MLVRLSIAAAFLFAFSCLASAGGINRSNATQVISRGSLTAILRSMNMKVEDVTEADGTPWLVVTTNQGDVFNVLLYVCGDIPRPSTPCEQLQLRMLWNNTKGRTADDVNKFHLEKVFGRGYLTSDAKMIGVEYPLHIKGGVTINNLKENIDYFLRVSADFDEIVKP
jgi:hypothetical protein